MSEGEQDPSTPTATRDGIREAGSVAPVRTLILNPAVGLLVLERGPRNVAARRA
jgi:hypothetical protein